MLPTHLQELLTAAVDGELTHAERRVVDTLLRDSEEARVFHAGLLRDAEALRHTPALAPAEDVASSIMAIISERGMRPTPLPKRRRNSIWTSSQFLPWFSVATAAIVLIAVSVVSFLFFATAQQNAGNADKDSAVNQPGSQPKTDPRAKQNDVKLDETNVAEMIRVIPRVVEANQVVQEEPRIEPELGPEPRVKGPGDVIAVSPQPDPLPLQRIELNLSLLLPLKDLDQPYPKKQLRDELKRGAIVRVDLFCRDSTKATELLQAALKARGQQMVVDGIAQDQLKKRLKTEYVFYTESLTAEEIAAVLEALGADDKKAEERKSGEGQFDKFLLAPFAPLDLRQLEKLLGVRGVDLKLPKLKAALDPRKSLESNTASQIASTLPKNGSSPSQKQTLVLSNGPFADPRTSKDIKSFLNSRGERKPGALPLMLVLIPR